MRRVILKRLLVSILVFGAVWLYVWGLHHYDVQSWIVDAGERSGLQVFNLSGNILWTKNGPFFDESPRADLWNWLVRHGPYQAAVWSSFLAASAAYGLCALGYRWRILGYRGPTRCGACGYGLSGLRKPRCPECGRAI